MYKTIVLVFLGIVLLAYGSLFLAWNLSPQEITSLVWAGQRYSQVLPLGSLTFIGLVVGALIMGVACASSYASLRAETRKSKAMIRRAKEKLQAQLDVINDLRADVERLEAEVASLQAGDGTWGQTRYEAAGEPAAAADAATPAAAADDDEII